MKPDDVSQKDWEAAARIFSQIVMLSEVGQKKVIARAIAAEREACAEVVRDHTPEKFEGALVAHVTGRAIERAIRARSTPC